MTQAITDAGDPPGSTHNHLHLNHLHLGAAISSS